jgi:hypothetical protein
MPALALHLDGLSCESAAAAGSAMVAAVKAANDAIFREFFMEISLSGVKGAAGSATVGTASAIKRCL